MLQSKYPLTTHALDFVQVPVYLPVHLSGPPKLLLLWAYTGTL